jgi:predicted nucleic acid-binding protein
VPSAPSQRRKPAAGKAGIYLDSSALVKLYLPEPESESLDSLLRGRRDLMISELSMTEVLSAVARRRREGALSLPQAYELRNALLSDADSGSFRRLHLSAAIHREAERSLLGAESVGLRTLDALHIALALSAPAASVATFDFRMRAAAEQAGLKVLAVSP